MMPRAWLALAVAALIAAAYGWGRYDGHTLLQASIDAASVKQAVADAQASARLAAEEQRARDFARSLEDAAHEDPVAVPVCLSVDRVRRLNLR